MMGFFNNLKESFLEGYRKNIAVVQNLDKVDLMAAKKSGGAKLFIFTDKSCLDSSPKTQQLLRDKVENYLRYINCEEFKGKVTNASKENTEIVIQVDIQPEPILMEFIKSMVPWANENNANILISIKNKEYEIS